MRLQILLEEKLGSILPSRRIPCCTKICPFSQISLTLELWFFYFDVSALHLGYSGFQVGELVFICHPALPTLRVISFKSFIFETRQKVEVLVS